MLETKDLVMLEELLTKMLDDKLKPIQEKVNKIDGIERDMKVMKTDIAVMRKDIDTVISFFDREYVDLRSRLERIEEHLHLPAYFK